MSAVGTGSITAINAVTWKNTVGLLLPRRGLFLGAEAGMPHISMEPLTSLLPGNTSFVEGEMFFDGLKHALVFNNGTAMVDISPITNLATAAGTAITSTTGVNLSAPLLLQLDNIAGAVWEIEWNVALLFSVTTATLVAKIVFSAGTSEGLWTIEGTNGAPDGAAVAKRASTNDLTVSIGATTAIGNPGSSTKPVMVRVRAVVKALTSTAGNIQLFLGSSSGSITPQKYSTMKYTRLA